MTHRFTAADTGQSDVTREAEERIDRAALELGRYKLFRSPSLHRRLALEHRPTSHGRRHDSLATGCTGKRDRQIRHHGNRLLIWIDNWEFELKITTLI